MLLKSWGSTDTFLKLYVYILAPRGLLPYLGDTGGGWCIAVGWEFHDFNERAKYHRICIKRMEMGVGGVFSLVLVSDRRVG